MSAHPMLRLSGCLFAVALLVSCTSSRDSSGATAASTSTTSATSSRPAPPTPTIAPTTVPASTAAEISAATQPSATISVGPVVQPQQPAAGPGGSDAAHAEWRESSGGVAADAWYVFEPIGPQPTSAPLAVVMHGYFEYEGYGSMYEFIRHTVLEGNIVIYPRWQTDVAAPCPGPFDIEPCISSALNGIRGAIEFLQSDPFRVQPDLNRSYYFGFSFGGIITANLANRYVDLGLPRPRVIFLDDPHDGGLNGLGEPALDDSMAGIPADALLQCHVGSSGVIAGEGAADSSCNALFPMLDHIPDANKDLVLTHPDDHGQPALSSGHGVCAAPRGQADAYDWGFCWKTWDALLIASDTGTNRAFALGDTSEHRDNGTWSDGVPVAQLTIQDSAPIRP